MSKKNNTDSASTVNQKKSKKPLVIVIVILIILILLGIGGFILYNTGIFRFIKVEKISGDVSVNKEDAIKGMNLKVGDTIKTYDDSNIELLVDSDKHILATENTKFTVNGKGTSFFGGMTIELLYGDALIEIDNKLNDSSSFVVNTPNASLSVRGTTFKASYSDEDETTMVIVEEGKVKVDTKKDSITLKEGESAIIIDDEIFTDAVVASDSDMADAEIGDIVYYGLYEQDNDLDNGAEPIEWIVIDADDDSVLLISKYAVDALNYNTDYNNDDEDTSFWYNSEIREYLNDDFLNEAFTEYEQKSLVLNTVVPDSEYYSYREGDKETEDYVYLLGFDEIPSYYDVREEDVLGAFTTWHIPELAAILTPYAETLTTKGYEVDERHIDEYNLPEEYLGRTAIESWLRTVNYNNSATTVGAFGLINGNGLSMSQAFGVRPVIRVSR